jgi:hypothetical protein
MLSYEKVGRVGEQAGGRSLSLTHSPSRALVTPYCKCTRPRRRATRRSWVSPLLFLPPLCSASRRPIWAGTRGDNLLVGPGTPWGRNADSWRTRPSARPPAVESTMSSPRGGRATSGSVPSPSPPMEEEAGQAWPSRRRHLVGCRASRRRWRPSEGHVGR